MKRLNIIEILLHGLLGFTFGYLLAIVITLPYTHKDTQTVEAALPLKSIDLIPVAVIDSGFDQITLQKAGVKLCPKGHFDAVNNDNNIGYDWSPVQHGTKMAILINKYAQGRACLVLIKAIDHDPFIQNTIYVNRALRRLVTTKDYIKIVSMSYSGPIYDEEERKLMSQLSYSNKITMFVAAGNDDMDLDDDCSVYPACYKAIDREVVVSATNAIHHNTGDVVKQWENGTELDLIGTSVATAIAAGKAAFKLSENAK